MSSSVLCNFFKARLANLFAFSLLLFLFCSAQTAASDTAGNSVFVKGSVTAQQVNESQRALKKDDDIFEFDRVQTGERSFTRLEFADGSKVMVRPNSKLNIDEYQSGKDTELGLGNGGALVEAANKKVLVNAGNAAIEAQEASYSVSVCSQGDCDRDVIGRVVKLKGRAQILNNEDIDTTSRPLAIGSPIYRKDQITVQADSYTSLSFIDNSKLTVVANTVFEISEYHFNEEGQSDRFAMNIIKGGLRTLTGVIGQRQPSAFTLTTPVATIGIRGTLLDTICDGNCANGGLFTQTVRKLSFGTNNTGTHDFPPGGAFFIKTIDDEPVVVPEIPERLIGNAPSPDENTPFMRMPDGVTVLAHSGEPKLSGPEGQLVLQQGDVGHVGNDGKAQVLRGSGGSGSTSVQPGADSGDFIDTSQLHPDRDAIPPGDFDLQQLKSLAEQLEAAANDCGKDLECHYLDCESANRLLQKVLEARHYLEAMKNWSAQASDDFLAHRNSLVEQSIITSTNTGNAVLAQGVHKFLHDFGSMLLDLASLAGTIEDLAKDGLDPSKVKNLDSLYETLKDYESLLDTVLDNADPSTATSGTGPINDLTSGADELMGLENTSTASLKSDLSDTLSIIENFKDGTPRKAGKDVGQLIGRVLKDISSGQMAEREKRIQELARDLRAEESVTESAHNDYARAAARRNMVEDTSAALDGAFDALIACMRKHSCPIETMSRPSTPSFDGWGRALRYYNALIPEIRSSLAAAGGLIFLEREDEECDPPSSVSLTDDPFSAVKDLPIEPSFNTGGAPGGSLRILYVRPLDRGPSGFNTMDPLNNYSGSFSGNSGSGFAVLLVSGSYWVPVSRFSGSASPDSCPANHYHLAQAISSPVTDCDGNSVGDPAPLVCGFGKVSDVVFISSCANP